MFNKKGVILLVLMLMLLFAAPLLLQLKEDNYFMRLLAHQVDDLAQSRRALFEAFNMLSTQHSQASNCETESYSEKELEYFWKIHENTCQITVLDVIVNYAVYHDEQVVGDKTVSYQQYTLRAGHDWLRVGVDNPMTEVLSWLYY